MLDGEVFLGRLVIIVALFVVGCATANMQKPLREFNFQEFTGLVSKQVKTYKDVVLDYDLDDENGQNVHINSCLQVNATTEETILNSQYGWYKLLLINCQALKIFTEKGVRAKRSYFPKALNREIVDDFPAIAVPQVSNEPMVQQVGKTLATDELELEISIVDKNKAEVIISSDYINYCIMARADFNQDGLEDLLVRMGWHVRDAFGKGTDLFILEKKSPTDPVTLTWRY
jgi:hypothetical protein